MGRGRSEKRGWVSGYFVRGEIVGGKAAPPTLITCSHRFLLLRASALAPARRGNGEKEPEPDTTLPSVVAHC